MVLGLDAGDVLSGTLSDGVRHSGVVEEWFGQHWWTTRSSLLLLTTLFVFAPLISFKRVGVSPCFNFIYTHTHPCRHTQTLNSIWWFVFWFVKKSSRSTCLGTDEKPAFCVSRCWCVFFYFLRRALTEF